MYLCQYFCVYTCTDRLFKTHLHSARIWATVRNPKQGRRCGRNARVVTFDGVTRCGEPRGVTEIGADFGCPGEGAADDRITVENKLSIYAYACIS